MRIYFIWFRYSTISFFYSIPVVYKESAISQMAWPITPSFYPCFVLSSLVNTTTGYVITDTGRNTYAETWRGISAGNISLQRPALYFLDYHNMHYDTNIL